MKPLTGYFYVIFRRIKYLLRNLFLAWQQFFIYRKIHGELDYSILTGSVINFLRPGLYNEWGVLRRSTRLFQLPSIVITLCVSQNCSFHLLFEVIITRVLRAAHHHLPLLLQTLILAGGQQQQLLSQNTYQKIFLPLLLLYARVNLFPALLAHSPIFFAPTYRNFILRVLLFLFQTTERYDHHTVVQTQCNNY